MKTTLSIYQIIEEWLDNLDVVNGTKKSYRYKILLWFRYLSVNKKNIRSPIRSDVLHYKYDLENKGYSSLTVDGYITVVKLFYKYCETARYCENVAAGIKSSTRYKGHRKTALTAEQALRLIQSITGNKLIDKRDRLIIYMMIYHGFRACEIKRININDFEMIENSIPVLKIQRKGRHDKSEIISLTNHVVDLFQDYITSRDCEFSGPLFVSHSYNYHDKRLSIKSISKMIKNRLSAIGINKPDVTAHSLRHTCASLMIDQGVDIETVKDILGHSSTSTTRIYASVAQKSRLIRHTPARYVEIAIENAKKQM